MELYCECPVDEAARRFVSRRRHPGHLDGAKSLPRVRSWLRAYERHLPLSLGSLLPVRTDRRVSPQSLGREIERLLGEPD